MRYIGVDVGKKRCQACIMDEEGEILEEFPFTNTIEGIQRLLECVDGKCKAVIESTDNLWLRIYESLEMHSVEVKLANPYKTKAIASARILAHLLRADLIAEGYVAPREVRQVRALLSQRARARAKILFAHARIHMNRSHLYKDVNLN
jgi:transposase